MQINDALHKAIQGHASDMMELLDDRFYDLCDEMITEFFPELMDAHDEEPTNDAKIEAYNTACQALVRLILTGMIDYITVRDIDTRFPSPTVPTPSDPICGKPFFDEDDGSRLICDRPAGHTYRDTIGHQKGHDEDWLQENNLDKMMIIPTKE